MAIHHSKSIPNSFRSVSVSGSLKFDFKFKKVSQYIISGNKKPTKVLNVIMSKFDSLGFLNHYALRWDEPIPDVINTTWEKTTKKTFVIFVYDDFDSLKESHMKSSCTYS